jgi:hypothetical protein
MIWLLVILAGVGLPTGTGQEFYQIISTIADVLTKISGLPKLDLG